MANTKNFYMPYYSSGVSGLYARVLQVGTGYWLDNTDGLFRNFNPATPGVFSFPLTEVLPSAPSVYYLGESRQIWPNGEYSAFSWDTSDFLFAKADMFIQDDSEVSDSDLLEYMELIKKIEEGNWELKNNQWIYYDTDGVTPLIIFNVFDKLGNPSMSSIFKRIRV